MLKAEQSVHVHTTCLPSWAKSRIVGFTATEWSFCPQIVVTPQWCLQKCTHNVYSVRTALINRHCQKFCVKQKRLSYKNLFKRMPNFSPEHFVNMHKKSEKHEIVQVIIYSISSRTNYRIPIKIRLHWELIRLLIAKYFLSTLLCFFLCYFPR